MPTSMTGFPCQTSELMRAVQALALSRDFGETDMMSLWQSLPSLHSRSEQDTLCEVWEVPLEGTREHVEQERES